MADRQAVDFVNTVGQTVLRYDSLKVSDALGRPVPAWIEVNEYRLVMDTSIAVYPLTVDPLFTSQVVTLVATNGAVDDYMELPV